MFRIITLNQTEKGPTGVVSNITVAERPVVTGRDGVRGQRGIANGSKDTSQVR